MCTHLSKTRDQKHKTSIAVLKQKNAKQNYKNRNWSWKNNYCAFQAQNTPKKWEEQGIPPLVY